MKRVLIGVIVAVIIFGGSFTYAQTTDTQSLLNQIQSLLKIVKQLQVQLSTIQTKNTSPSLTTNTPVPPFCLSTNLRIGTRSNAIQQLQRFLKQTGDFTYPTTTGYYGNVTKSAVQRYQSRNHVVSYGSNEYGLMGVRTLQYMCTATQKTQKTTINSTTPVTTPTNGLTLSRSLYIGTKGTDVTKLQQFLRSTGDFTYPTITGYYGSVTAKAVQRYQCRTLNICSGTQNSNGYGVVGPKTRAMLRAARRVATNTPITPTPTPQPIPTPIIIPTTPTPPPVTYAWNTSSWSSCADNTQSRTVTCKGSDNNTYSDAKCTSSKPTTSNTCSSTPIITTTNKKCSLNGKDIAHNTNIISYLTNSVPYGQTCTSQTRVCTNGTLSGSYTYDTCSIYKI